MYTFYSRIQCFQKCTQILRIYVHYSELCFFMSITWKGFGQFRKIANMCYTTCPFGDNSTPRLVNALCIKKADLASTCINLILSALSHSANTLCFLSKIKRHARVERKQIFLWVWRGRLYTQLKKSKGLWGALKLESLAVPSKPSFYKKASHMVVVLLKENAKHTKVETIV